MCSVGRDVMGTDLFGNPDGRLIVNADVPIADHGTHCSMFLPTINRNPNMGMQPCECFHASYADCLKHRTQANQ